MKKDVGGYIQEFFKRPYLPNRREWNLVPVRADVSFIVIFRIESDNAISILKISGELLERGYQMPSFPYLAWLALLP